MRYAFLEKRSNKQQETAYMVYMIIGSYFHKCTCKTKILEKKLFLSYKEMGKDKQEEKESRIIKVVERVLGQMMEVMKDMNANASIIKDGNELVVCFYTGFENIYATIDKSGYFHISYDEYEYAA